jgi:general transcription factor 3C polypeptide 1
MIRNLNDALVYLKPWIRIDGTLNRRVLDRMLGEVLSHAMLKPGCAVLQLSLLFFPVIQPFQVRELVEVI